MPITELLTRNATYFKDDIALVEINPEVKTYLTLRGESILLSSPTARERSENSSPGASST